jgi:MFS family permease
MTAGQRDQSGLAGFLGLNRNVVLLLCAIVLIGSGEETWMRFVPKYLEGLGATAFVIGMFDAIKTLLGAVYAFPGGLIVDRWGHRRAFVAFTIISIAGYAAVLWSASITGVIAGMFLFLAWSTLSLPETFSLVASSLPAGKHAMGIGIQSLIKRVPVLIGPVAGGLLIDRLGLVRGVHAGVAVTIILALCALGLQSEIRSEDRRSRQLRWNLIAVVRGFDPELRHLLVSDILIRFCERLPYAWVVIYAMDQPGVTAAGAGALIAIEMAAAMACYVPTAYLADRFGKEPFVIATFVFFTLFPLSLLFAKSFLLLAVAFAIRGLKEFGEPARKGLIIHFSPPETRGQSVGAYYLIRDLTVTAGSFVGVILWKISPEANFTAAAVLGALGTLFYVQRGARRASAAAAP